MNDEVPGSYESEQLASLPGFGMTTLVCPAQGEVAEKNWRRAGEFEDLARLVSLQAEQSAPPSPEAPPAAETASSSAADVDSMLNTAGNRLFSHVADLMKELENRREERALAASLQRQISALKDELVQTRERADMLEMRLPHLAELEESRRKDQAALESLRTTLQAHEHQINESRISAEKAKNDCEGTKRRLTEAQGDLAIRNRLVDKLSKELSDKELSLAKALGLIRRLEEDLNRLCPGIAPSAGLTTLDAAQSPAPVSAPAHTPTPDLLVISPPADENFTMDDPPPPPPYIEPAPAERPKAHEALVHLLRKLFPGPTH
ncbi:MAG TPA: hypothetical protein DCZ01_03610 [Elusimicrobia bacterium]|nr:MAG: hypothetical protein A2X37_05860 [Elusimicrobia bacterium GWA2_66_18]OGR70611.1 MAG: hypothetical protein A2X40_07515 [Elusimicrobia bacterium GWC2_65_9]HAZ07615.1 hypothetical protein [Elusimicrobiota bacterium]